MNQKLTLAVVIGVLVCLAGLFVSSERSSVADDRQAEEDPVARFMRTKLENSQKVLEGLVTEDFKLIRDGAEQMQLMSRAAEWQVIQGPVYTQYSREFRRSADQLIKMAEDKNTDGAGLAYVQLTLNCLSCHKFVRSVKVAAGEEISPEFERALSGKVRLAGAN